MKKLLLVVAMILSSTFIALIQQPLEVEAKTVSFSKKEINAIKKGTFLHAKGKIGTTQQTLKKKGLKKQTDGESVMFTQNYDSDLIFYYDFTVYNTIWQQYETFETVQMLSAHYGEQKSLHMLNRYFKRVKAYDVPYYHIVAYKVDEKYMLVHQGDETHIDMFKNKKVLDRFMSIAN